MTFRFGGCTGNNCGANGPGRISIIDMCLERRFSDGSVVQAIITNVNGSRTLAYRESTTGSWRNSSGITFGDLSRIPENMTKALGKGDFESEQYVIPLP